MYFVFIISLYVDIWICKNTLGYSFYLRSPEYHQDLPQLFPSYFSSVYAFWYVYSIRHPLVHVNIVFFVFLDNTFILGLWGGLYLGRRLLFGNCRLKSRKTMQMLLSSIILYLCWLFISFNLSPYQDIWLEKVRHVFSYIFRVHLNIAKLLQWL